MIKPINDLFHNYFRDLQKKEISNFERARIIKQYMESNSLSGRKFAEKFGFAKSTIEDWLLWNNISEDKYKELLNEGYSVTEIYRYLRERKKLQKKDNDNQDPLYQYLKNTIKNLKNKRTSCKADHVDLLKELINTCNYCLMYGEKRK